MNFIQGVSENWEFSNKIFLKISPRPEIKTKLLIRNNSILSDISLVKNRLFSS